MMKKLSQRSARRLQYAVSCCLCCFLVFISSVAFAAPRLAVPPEGVAFGEVSVGSAEHARDLKGTVPHAAIECCQCESVASSNVASFQLAIGKWNWILATMATFPKALSRTGVSQVNLVQYRAVKPNLHRIRFGERISTMRTAGNAAPIAPQRQTAIGYDSATGRIATMLANGSDIPFTWPYLPGSDLKSSLAYPNGLVASWTYDANDQLLHGYHEGAALCMRSKSVNGHANQCCYDKCGKLITHGSGSGSADYAPGEFATFFEHREKDMFPADWAKKLDGGIWGDVAKHICCVALKRELKNVREILEYWMYGYGFCGDGN